MNKQRNRIAIAAAALLLTDPLAVASGADPPAFETRDYQQVGAVILEAEAPPQQAQGTLFVSFVEGEGTAFVPGFQALYPNGVTLKGEGSDGAWDASRQRLIDRTTGEAATAVFISAPRALPDGEVDLGVTAETPDGHNHNGVYRFHRSGDGWALTGTEPVR